MYMLTFHELTCNRATDRACVFTFGTFDGVHLGHQQLFYEVIAKAKAEHLLAVVLTFTTHPLSIVRPDEALQLITTPEEKHVLLQQAGFDISVEVPFTKEFSELSADGFIDRLMHMLPIKYCIVGPDVVYGHQRLGNREHLTKKALEYGFEVIFLPKVTRGNESISSTRIRQLLREGRGGEAEQLLGRPLRL